MVTMVEKVWKPLTLLNFNRQEQQLVALIALCTPGMGVNLWGVSHLYVNPVNVLNTLAKVLADGKGISARSCLKEARVQSYEPTNRNGI